MTTVLIVTEPNDYHAAAVEAGIRAFGGNVFRWIAGNWPQRQFQYFRVDHGRPQMAVRDEGFGDFDFASADVVWMRRSHAPLLPSGLHPLDDDFIKSEARASDLGWRAGMAPGAVWINPYQRARAGESKQYQLMVAVAAGLRVPETLMTNDPDAVREFLDTHAGSGVIFKNHTGVFLWREEGRNFMCKTAVVSRGTLPVDEIIRCSPGIYQERIVKAFELRVVYLGGEIIAARLDSQQHPRSVTDWRVSPGFRMPVSEFELPASVCNQVRDLMTRMGLLFGSLDLIVTPQGEYVFLEVNQQGQFLWLEDRQPRIRMLDRFCRFLMDPERRGGLALPSQELDLAQMESSGEIGRILAGDAQACVPSPIRHGYLR